MRLIKIRVKQIAMHFIAKWMGALGKIERPGRAAICGQTLAYEMSEGQRPANFGQWGRELIGLGAVDHVKYRE